MRHVLGIDLGTTNSLACMLEDGAPVIIVNERGSRMTPSVLSFRNEREVLVGELAKSQAVLNRANTVSYIKRHMGTNHRLTLMGREYTPLEISALILRKLKAYSEEYLGTAIQDVVITVPAYFNDNQRLATKLSGELAGFRVLKLLNEPTAAALAYSMHHEEDAQILVVDLGGGTLDISLLEHHDRVHRVRASGGSTMLGGIDFDQRIVDHLCSEFLAAHGVDLKADPVAYQQLVICAEKAKVDLSTVDQTQIMVPYITVSPQGPLHLNTTLTRQAFELLVSDLADSVRRLIRETFDGMGLPLDWANQVILVGGATRMPLIGRLIQELTGIAPKRDLNPDEVVAKGAAIQAGILADQIADIEFYDVTSHTLGIEDDDGTFIPIIPNNEPYPTERSRVFTTVADDQDRVEIHIMQQSPSHPELPLVSLGRFALENIPPMPKGSPSIEVAFAVDKNGILQVTAHDLEHGMANAMTITDMAFAPSREDQPPQRRGGNLTIL